MLPTSTTASISAKAHGTSWVTNGARVVADTTRPVALHEFGFAPHWYVPRENIDESALSPAGG